MRFALLALSLLALLCLAFPAGYTSTYTDGWAKVTRNVEVVGPSCAGGVTGVCSDTGALVGTRTYTTYVNLTVENTDPVERQKVELVESLQYVPAGARLSFNPVPSSSTGRSATFSLGSIPAGGSKAISYVFQARITENQIAAIAPPDVSSLPPRVQLFAPAVSNVNSRIQLSLLTLSGDPVPGTLITVEYPDGTSQEMRTDYRGKVSFTAEKLGFYAYYAQGYDTAKIISTNVLPEEEKLPPAAAAGAVLFDQGIASMLSGLLPVLAAIFGLAVLVLIIYNFFASRDQSEERAEAPAEQQYYYGSPPPEPEPVAYTQKFSFADTAAPQPDPDRDATRNLVEARKKHMQAAEVAAAEPQHNGQQAFEEADAAPAAEAAPAYPAAETAPEVDEVAEELEKLEEETVDESDLEGQEAEIESAIAELEEIRKKLRERRDQVLRVEQQLEEEAQEPNPPKKPQPRVMPPSERLEPAATPFPAKKK